MMVETNVREPAVAGSFYPSDPAALKTLVAACLAVSPSEACEDPSDAGPAASPPPGRIIALVVPHAGYVYSGRIAGATYAAATLPRAFVILCPNHTGEGHPLAVMNRGGWTTPLGLVRIDEPLADALLDSCPAAEADARAHQHEHSLEVQLPFLQTLLGDFTFVPVCLGTSRLERLTELGEAIAAATAGAAVEACVVISTDMSHYLPAASARRLDRLAIERILAIDPEGLHRAVTAHDISMCGFAPAVAGLAAARKRGATAARLVAYGHSGQETGDLSSVVAYAGALVW